MPIVIQALLHTTWKGHRNQWPIYLMFWKEQSKRHKLQRTFQTHICVWKIFIFILYKKFHCLIITFFIVLLYADNLTSGIPLSDQAKMSKGKQHHIPSQWSTFQFHRKLLFHVFFIFSSSLLLAFTEVKGILGK